MNAKPITTHPMLFACLLISGSTGVLAAQEDHRLGVRRAVEVEFEAERGHSYRLQRSTDLVHWEDVGEEVYGHGRREERLISTRGQGSGGIEVFRVVAAEAPTDGPAPWALTGVVLNLDDAPGGDVLRFLSETDGVDQGEAPDPFTYTYTVTGTLTAGLVLRFKADKWDEYDLNLQAGANAGAFVRREFDRNTLKDTDTGSPRGRRRRVRRGGPGRGRSARARRPCASRAHADRPGRSDDSSARR